MRDSAYSLASQQCAVREPCLNFRQLIAVCKRLLWLKERYDKLLAESKELRAAAALARRTLILPPQTASEEVYAIANEILIERRRRGLDSTFGLYGRLASALERQR